MNRFLAVSLSLVAGTSSFLSPCLAGWAQTHGPLLDQAQCFSTYGPAVLIGTRNGKIFRSVDNGESWKNSSTTHYYRAVESMTASDGAIIAGTDRGIFYSVDTGITWIKATVDQHISVVVSLAASHDTVFAGTTGSFCISTDNGKTWKKSRRAPPPFFLQFTGDLPILLAAFSH